MGPCSTGSHGASAGPANAEPDQTLEVVVLFTDLPSTLSAFRTASQLAEGLRARIRVFLMQVVPFPLPLDEPDRDLQFADRQFRALIDHCPPEAVSRAVETTAEIVLCRDAWDALRTRLKQGSVVVIGKRSRWFLRTEDRLARQLRSAGHHVVRTAGRRAPALSPLVTKGLAHA